MGYSKQIAEAVREAYENKRKKAEADLDARRAEMYEKAPQLREIDRALSLTGLKLYGAALEGKEGLEDRIAALKKENLELQTARRFALQTFGKPNDYLSLRYECPKCQDTGYIGLKMCDCMRRALIKEAYETSGLGAVLTEQSFENFDLTYYSDHPDASGVSMRDRMTKVLAEAQAYAKTFDVDFHNKKVQNLLFVGKTGLGKTHISTAIAGSVIRSGYDVVYDTVQNILHNYEVQTFAKNSDAAAIAADMTERYLTCALLVIDDLGTEFKSGFTAATLYGLLNTRIISGLPMIINTNLDTKAKLREQYDDRILSRLLGSFTTYHFVGEDIRIKRRLEQ